MPPKLRRFVTFWREAIDTGKEKQEMLTWLIPAAIWLLAQVLQRLGISLPFLSETTSEEVTTRIGQLTGILLIGWLFIWRPFVRYDALELRLHDLEAKKGVRDALGEWLLKLEYLLQRVRAIDALDLAESDLSGEMGNVITGTRLFLESNLDKAHAALFMSNVDLQSTPVSKPILIPEVYEANKLKQDMIDYLTHYARQLKRIIEET